MFVCDGFSFCLTKVRPMQMTMRTFIWQYSNVFHMFLHSWLYPIWPPHEVQWFICIFFTSFLVLYFVAGVDGLWHYSSKKLKFMRVTWFCSHHINVQSNKQSALSCRNMQYSEISFLKFANLSEIKLRRAHLIVRNFFVLLKPRGILLLSVTRFNRLDCFTFMWRDVKRV